MSRPTFHVPYLRVMRSPHYVPLWLGQVVSNLGDTLNYVALVVLVFGLSHSGLAVSGLVLTEIVPTLLLGPGAGILIALVRHRHDVEQVTRAHHDQRSSRAAFH